MKLLIGFLLLTLAYIFYQGIRINQLRIISGGLVEKATPFQQEPDNPSKRVLIIGDSLQAGVGASSPANSMAGLLGSDHPDWEIVNLAVSGFETGDALEKLENSDERDFDLVIVQIGANDIFHRKNLDQATDNLQQLLELVKIRSDKVLYVTSGSVGYPPLMPLPADWYFTARSQRFIPEFIQVAQELDIPVLDNYRDREIDIFETNPDLYYAADKFHLSDAGYLIWYERLQEKLKDID